MRGFILKTAVPAFAALLLGMLSACGAQPADPAPTAETPVPEPQAEEAGPIIEDEIVVEIGGGETVLIG